MEKTSDTYLATVEELMKSWKLLTVDEQARAEALLLQASNYLRLVAKNNSKDIDAMMAPDANSWSQSATPYSEAMSFSGDVSSTIYFKTRELQLLGLGGISGSKQIGILRGVR